MAIERHEHAVNMNQLRLVQQLVDKILPLFNHKPKVLCEQALLWAYCSVSDGVQQLPQASRNARAALIVEKSSRAIVDAIREVAALSDTAVNVFSAGEPTCKH